jgi:hypothetical protein
VVVGLHGGRSQGVLRLDLPGEEAAHDPIASLVTGTLCRIREADGLAIVVYSDLPLGPGERRTAAGLVTRVATSALRAGFFLAGAWCVACDGWDSYTAPVAGGRSLDELARGSHPGLVSSEGRPARMHDDQAPTAEEFRAAVARLEGGAAFSDSAVFSGGVQRRPVSSDIGETVGFLEALLAGNDPPEAEALARLFVMIASPGGRDAALLQIAFGPEAGRMAMQVHGQDHVAAFLAGLVSGHSDVRPDPVRLRRGAALLDLIGAVAPNARSGAVHSMNAWLSWAAGRGSDADRQARRALECEPGYGFARLLRAMFRTGWLPQWLFASRDPR